MLDEAIPKEFEAIHFNVYDFRLGRVPRGRFRYTDYGDTRICCLSA
jgi:hypothetical protein